MPTDRVLNVFRYTYALPVGKALTSIGLPSHQYVVLMGVNVTSSNSPYNSTGVATAGTKYYAKSGFDASGNAYDRDSLQSVLSVENQWSIQPGALNTIASVGQVIDTTSHATTNEVRLLGAAVFGDQVRQEIILGFSDGSTETWTQSFSDWIHSKAFPGERVVGLMDHQITSEGNLSLKSTYLFEYSYQVPTGKRLTSIQLPKNGNVRILSIAVERDEDEGHLLRDAFFNRLGSVRLIN
ncbi:MAG: hypothetical protein P1U77_22915 [Rubripirellula sp.]|nr:hypothetical protein [Rubripirellula sp.]